MPGLLTPASCHEQRPLVWKENRLLKEDKTPTSIGGELRQVILGGSPIFFQDKASQQVRLGVLEEKCDYGLVP